MMDIGSHIKQYRLEKKLSRKALSELIGLSPGYIEEIESNKKKPTIDTLQKFGAFFNVTISELIGEVKNDFPPELKELLDNVRQLPPEKIELLNTFIREFALGHKPKYVKTKVNGEDIEYIYNEDERPPLTKEEEEEASRLADRLKEIAKEDPEQRKKLEEMGFRFDFDSK